MYKSIKGFTLIELAVSIALLSLLTFGIAELFPRSISTVKRSQSITIAANLAQAEIETLISESYQTIGIGTIEIRHMVSTPFERQTVVRFVNPATLATSSTDTGLKRIDVTVFYPTLYGTKTFILSTLVAQL